ncbi:MAG TPA: DUF3667 domain-containing protein [Longimicrobiales bacterium]
MAETCPNCGAAAGDRYCAHCGQKLGDRLLSTRAIARDVIEDSLSLESRLPRTLGTLLARPGRLTRDYAEGRIARYMTPVRLYVTASLVFFLVLSFVADFDLLWSKIGPEIMNEPDDYVLLRTDFRADATPRWLRGPVIAWEAKVAELNALEPREGVRVLYDATIGAVPPIVFLLVPGFALILKLLYRKRYYAEHFVFVLHAHALGFILAALALLVRETWLAVLLAVGMLVWLFAALRVNYAETAQPREPRWRTSLKYVALLTAYWLALSGTVILVMITAVMSI